MTDASKPTFDEAAGNRYFSVTCFNRTWDLIDKPDRTPADDEQMLLRTYASFWHWTQRPDCTPRNLSVGYWQLARVHALLNQPELSRHYGELSLKHAAGEAPFFIGYAHEALARAERAAGDQMRCDHHLAEARNFAKQVTDAEDRELLVKDLEALA